MHTWVEVSKSALEHNLKQFRKIIGPNKLLMPVIKANAYGHGFLDVAKVCMKNREVDRICVVNDDEASTLINNELTKKPIMILSFYELDNQKTLRLAKNNVIFPLFSLKQAKFLNTVGESLRKKVVVHLKIDTGTSRIGLLPSDVAVFIQKIKSYKNIIIEGVWSHFASSEDNREYTEHQYKIFTQATKTLQQSGINPPIKHMSCTAATILYPLKNFNAIRLGIGLYGLQPSSSTAQKIKLRPALSWYTKIIQVKNLLANTKVGYGGTYITKKTTTLAVLPVGYWDGYDRKLSNCAEVIINNTRCPIIGRICMNLCMVDVSQAGKVKVGDKVILIGENKKVGAITAEQIANLTKSINYEIVCRINPLLPRKIVK